MKNNILAWLSCMLVSFTVRSQDSLVTVDISEDLKIIKLSPNAWLHVSWTSAPGFGRFNSNGLIYMNGGEAVVMDTPPDEPLTRLLLDWMAKTFPEVSIKAIIVNHFHNDCLGGLQLFHQAGIASYGNHLTPLLIIADSVTGPQHTFHKKFRLKVGDETVICRYFGEAHTKDNIVTWIPSEKILFGGCMVKSLNSGKGNLADANLQQWPATVKRVKKAFADAAIVIPGHGAYGGTALLDYTIEMFAPKE